MTDHTPDTPEPESPEPEKLPLLAAPADIVTGFPVQAPADDPDVIKTKDGILYRNLGRAGQPNP